MKDTEWRQIIHTVGRTTRELRLLLGWSQQHLADRAITSQGAISRLESGTAGALSLHTVVIAFRALAVGAHELEIPLSPIARALLVFSDALNPTFTLTTPADPDLLQLVHAFHRVPARRRQALLHLVEATVALSHQELGAAEEPVELMRPLVVKSSN
jgi:transcriptional regulator with XRE-family HTH domain